MKKICFISAYFNSYVKFSINLVQKIKLRAKIRIGSVRTIVMIWSTMTVTK